MTISLDSSTSNPVGTENGLVTRNIPSGTQIVGGEVTSDQGLAAPLDNAWPVNITDGYNILGTSNNPIAVVPSAISSTPITFVAVGTTISGTETMLTLTPTFGYVAGTNGTSFTVTSGKTLVIQSFTVLNSNTNLQIKVRLRISSSGSVTTSTTPVVSLSPYQTTSTSMEFPLGLQLTGNNQIGVSAIGSSSNIIDVYVVGYTY